MPLGSPQQRAWLQPPWQPGQSANAHGAQKGYRRVLTAARRGSLEAMETVLGLLRDPEVAAATRLAAAVVVLERAWGKPKEHIQLDGDGIATLQIRFVDERAADTTIDGEAFQLSLRHSEEENKAE